MAVTSVALTCADDNGNGKPAHSPAEIASSSSFRLLARTSTGTCSPEFKVHGALTSVTSLRDVGGWSLPTILNSISRGGTRKSLPAVAPGDAAAMTDVSTESVPLTCNSGSAVRMSRMPIKKPGSGLWLGSLSSDARAQQPVLPPPPPPLPAPRSSRLRRSTMKRSTSMGVPTFLCKVNGSSTACVGPRLGTICATVDCKRRPSSKDIYCWSGSPNMAAPMMSSNLGSFVLMVHASPANQNFASQKIVNRASDASCSACRACW
mmetsp:Transcript_94862/g.237918  ORF Transcript_94862/g.237918 Transcript_94862/m.237918 type:complete len:263 (-) Transcript_94862:585-1373(-)